MYWNTLYFYCSRGFVVLEFFFALFFTFLFLLFLLFYVIRAPVHTEGTQDPRWRIFGADVVGTQTPMKLDVTRLGVLLFTKGH